MALLVPVAALPAQDLLDELWPEAKVYIKTGQTSRIYLQAAGTHNREDGYTDGALGAYVDFFFKPLMQARQQRNPDVSRGKMVMIRAGYFFAKTPPGSEEPFTEHTPLIETTPRFFLPKLILLENRFRVDLRFVDGEFLPRFRDRLRVERTFGLRRTALTPYAEFETFYDWRYNAFHRQRYSAGSEWVVTKRFVVEGYYLRQQDSEASVKGIDVVGLVLQFYFR